MPQTNFALRGFDEKRILQRPWFKKFNLPVADDTKILQELTDSKIDSRDVLESNLSLIRDLSRCLSSYINLIDRHYERLNKLLQEASRHMKELEKLVSDLIPEMPPQRDNESKIAYVLRTVTIKQNEYLIKLAEIGKFYEYTNCWGLYDVADTYKIKYADIGEHVEQLKKALDTSCEALITEIKKYNRKVFAAQLKQARQNKGFKQRELAEKIGMTQNSYSSYEIGRADPPLTTLIRLSRELNCTTDSLLGLT